MDDKYIVYEHINKVNNKKYIGITKQEPNERWRNGHGYYNQRKFYNAILKYGWDNFEHNILFENLTEEEALNKEYELIEQLNNIKNGYNSQPGGMYIHHWTDEQKKRLSDRNKGHAISQKVYDIFQNQWLNTKKSVLCIETDTVYDSISDASRSTGIDDSSIGRACRGKAATAGGYHWEYNNTIDKENYENKRTIAIHNADNVKKKIYCVELNKVYNSITEAADIHHILPTNIIKSCKGIIATSGGYHWQYADKIEQQKYKTKNKKPTIEVLCVELNKSFKSAYEAQQVLGIDRGSIAKSIKYGNKAGGYHWSRVQGVSDDN